MGQSQFCQKDVQVSVVPQTDPSFSHPRLVAMHIQIFASLTQVPIILQQLTRMCCLRTCMPLSTKQNGILYRGSTTLLPVSGIRRSTTVMGDAP